MQHQHRIEIPIADRQTAGQALVPLLLGYRGRADTLVLALPRGGVPVAYEIARTLGLRLDLMPVRKLGVPFHEELAMGAIAGGGVCYLNTDVVNMHRIDGPTLEAAVERELKELNRRERAYRGDHPLPDLRDQQVILVDDGLATGATMRAAIQAVRDRGAARVIVAVPVAPSDTLAELREEVDEVVCPFVPQWFTAIGCWYVDFSQVADQEVIDLLNEAWERNLQEHAEPRETTDASTSTKH
ncbi:phosphoribosyltransferase [Metapseudomonas furukawaii]|uniref:phosphoribosyltransferase n=1 Tax=Metapseudomonas furukawaii TaxID=1149133 RepID=UPI00227A691C|nr:phosphoribosyltransferase [Pseudomonas furukawaii]WAG81177.1 phosphoribosyltransferase [Pseudomonas furukawaii]